MKAAELFVRCLENEGVQTIFGLPGEENAHLMVALEASKVAFILTRHEQGAAFMADVFGRLTGTPGVCLATLGPGATNLVTGVADANMDRAPVVAITAQADTKRLHKESHQAMDVIAMFRPLTKWTSSIAHPDNVPEITRKAFKLAVSQKPGACHIELPEDIARLETKKIPLPAQKQRRPVPDEKIVGRAIERLAAAKRPVILAGNGTIRTRANRQLREFAERTGIGVISTFMGKGAVSRHSPQCLYTLGLQAKDVVLYAVETADLVLCVGYDIIEYHPRLWNPAGDKPIIHVDFQPAEVDENYQPEVEVVGDIGHALWMFNQQMQRKTFSFDLKTQASVRKQMAEEIAHYKDDDTTGSLRPQKVLWDVREALGPTDILLSDVGAHKMWIARYYACDEPNTCLISNGFCSMGFALPGAIAAKLVYPDRRVLAICGDGGFLMNVQEMETATRLATNIVVMVWEDKGYGLIQWKQDNEFGHHTRLEFGNPDWLKLAESFGWAGFHVDKSRELRETLEKAFRAGKPALISLPIDSRENKLLTKRLGDIACPI